MLPISRLEQAFGIYLREIDACIRGRCYWALLHLVVVLPDVCGALESAAGEANKNQYLKWCDENLPGTPLLPKDRYEMRCKVLHQGTSVHKRGSFSSVSFVDPDSPLARLHGTVQRDAAETNITLDVSRLAKESVLGLKKWFARLQQPNHQRALKNVAKNIRSLVRVQQKTGRALTSLPDGSVTEARIDGLTTSST